MEAGFIEEYCLNGSWLDENSIVEMEVGLIEEYCLNV